MKPLEDGVRSRVRVGYDGTVHKTFCGTDAEPRFANEVRLLKYLEERDCPYTPQLLETHADELRLVTTHCGPVVERLSEAKVGEIFDELEKTHGVRLRERCLRNITYSQVMGRFCVIDFERAEIIGEEEPAMIPTQLSIDWCGVTEKGVRKLDNEDSLIVFSADSGGAVPLPLNGDGDLLQSGFVLVISDGLGGHAAGALASCLVVSKLAANLVGGIGHLRATARPLALLTVAVEEAHESINRLAAGKPDIDGMAATLVGAWFWGRHLHFVHVGDSRLYRWRKGELTQLSDDHTRVGRLFRDGMIDEGQARAHPMSHVVEQVVGGQHQSASPQVGTLLTLPGDWYLLCSDGVTDGLWNQQIAEMLAEAAAENREASELAEAIRERAFGNAGRDDTTLIVARIEG